MITPLTRTKQFILLIHNACVYIVHAQCTLSITYNKLLYYIYKQGDKRSYANYMTQPTSTMLNNSTHDYGDSCIALSFTIQDGERAELEINRILQEMCACRVVSKVLQDMSQHSSSGLRSKIYLINVNYSTGSLILLALICIGIVLDKQGIE